MRDPFSRSVNSLSSRDSWLQRVRENFHQLFTPTGIFPRSANGAPIHLLQHGRSARSGHAQSASVLTHAAIIIALALLAMHPPKKDPPFNKKVAGPILKFPGFPITRDTAPTPNAGTGSGGGNVPIPTTSGALLPSSPIQIVRPSLPPQKESVLPVPPTILDPSAQPVLTSVEKIGLPWMKDDTNSPGPGDSNTIGSTTGRTMGDGTKDGPGGTGSSEGPYRQGVTYPKCAYCPDPQYTDEAREGKVQGHVMLQVLVGADGRAAQVRIVQGIGFGLDERAAQAVRGWKFVPAYDAAHHPVASWVTVEAMFRLF